jgi:hypothetical protein
MEKGLFNMGLNEKRVCVLRTATILLVGMFILSLLVGAVTAATGKSEVHSSMYYQTSAVKEEHYIYDSESNTQYLRDLANETWNCIDYYVDDEMGLPYDNSGSKDYTGIDKIGLYIASVAVAKELGIISKDESMNRLNNTLNTLLSKDFETWDCSGTEYENLNISIPYTWYIWNNTKIPEPKPPKDDDDIDICAIDLGNYYACLIIGRNAFPELNQSFSKLLDNINWSLLYDKDTNLFYGGYNTKTGTYSTWHCEYLASDSQTASFLGIATEAVPTEHWGYLNSSFENCHGHKYYVSACDGGLYLRFLPGIFIDQRQTLMGMSAKEFTRSQIDHANNICAPVWGWSPSASVPVNISDTDAIIFYYKGTGSSNTLQLKLEDADGCVRGKRLYNATNTPEWTKARINYSELENYTRKDRGDNKLDYKNIINICFAIESGERDGRPVGEGGGGTLSIRNVTLRDISGAVGIDDRFYGSWDQQVSKETNLSLLPDPDNKTITMQYDLRTGDENKWVLMAKSYGYLDCMSLEDRIVTPHASVLALSYFDDEVIENLKKLEEMGARDPILVDGENYSFGFRDAINWKDEKVSEKYLILDQAMIFLSIANYLNGTVWDLFMNDSSSKNGIHLIEDYRIIYFAEGENWTKLDDDKNHVDIKSRASNCSCLGNSWGKINESAEYLINLSEDANGVLFKMRYSDRFNADNKANHVSIYVDDELKGELYTEDTGDWNIFKWSDKVDIGHISAGEHELKIVSGNGGEWNCVNLDCFKLFREEI